MTTLYYVYRILNTLDGKSYIGLTKDIEARWVGHFNALKRNEHPNYWLQSAFNKCGADAFTTEVIEYAVGKRSMAERERFWIDHFGHSSNGVYNIMGTDQTTPCKWQGVEYPSIAACAHALGVSVRDMKRRLSMPEKVFFSYSDGPVTLGRRLKDIRAAFDKTLEVVSKDSGISLSYLSDIERGRTTPSIPMLVKLATLYGMTVQEFIAPVDEWRLPR